MEIPFEKTSMQMLNVGYVRHNGDWNWQNVSSPFTRIYYVTEGEAMIHFIDKSIRLTANHLYIVPAHTEHSYECHGVFSHYYLHMFEQHHTDNNLLETYILPSEVEGSSLDRELLQKMCEAHPEAQLPSSERSRKWLTTWGSTTTPTLTVFSRRSVIKHHLSIDKT